MITLSQLKKRASKFRQVDLVRATKLHRHSIYLIMSGKNANPTVATIKALEVGLGKLETEFAKKFSRKNPAKKQSPSRDAKRRVVAGVKA